jgi:integrase
MIDHHPCARMQMPAPPCVRHRVLTDAELSAVWRATYRLSLVDGAYYRLLILGGQRRTETARMRWADISDGVWTIPADHAKNGRAHAVPLSRQMMAELDALPRLDESPWVLVKPINNPCKIKTTIDQLSGVTGWVTHDLRRTAATGLASLGIAPHVIERILNHRSGVISGVAGIYNRHSYADECRAALQAWADHVESLLTPD